MSNMDKLINVSNTNTILNHNIDINRINGIDKLTTDLNEQDEKIKMLTEDISKQYDKIMGYIRGINNEIDCIKTCRHHYFYIPGTCVRIDSSNVKQYSLLQSYFSMMQMLNYEFKESTIRKIKFLYCNKRRVQVYQYMDDDSLNTEIHKHSLSSDCEHKFNYDLYKNATRKMCFCIDIDGSSKIDATLFYLYEINCVVYLPSGFVEPYFNKYNKRFTLSFELFRICILSELCLLKQTLDNMSWFRRIRYHKYIKIVDKMLQIYKKSIGQSGI